MAVSSSTSVPMSVGIGEEGRTSSANSEDAWEERGEPKGESSASIVR